MTSDGNLWRATGGAPIGAAPLDGLVAADIAIIGGGFTGCAAALEAARGGASVCLLEAEVIGHGGSGRNVGLVNAGLWLPPDEVVARLGAEAGARLIAALAAAPDRVFDLIAREGIDCEARRAGTLHLAHSPGGLRDLEARLTQGRRLGAPLALLDAAETARRTGTAAYHGALFDPRAGTIQPLAYVRGLARAAQRSGAALHEASPVRALERRGDVWHVTTPRGEVRARAVLVATNAYHLGPLAGFRPEYVAVHYGQVATDPLPAGLRATLLPGGEGCWDTAMVMSSFRTDREGRLILGAIGDFAGAGGRLHRDWATRKMALLFPDMAGLPFRHCWSGRIAMTGDHVPKVVRFGVDALAVFGYSGRGIGPGTVLGTEAARALLQGDMGRIPLDPVTGHREGTAPLREAALEVGACLAHAVDARGHSRRVDRAAR